MSKRMLAVALAACVFAGGVLFAWPARAADTSDSQTLQSQVKEKRNQVKSERRTRKDQRKADRQQRQKDHKSFLRSLWPFGKDKEEEVPFAQQKRFGTGNPRDASQAKGPTRPVSTKVHSHKRVTRDGSNYTRPEKAKKGRATANKASANSHADKRVTHSHKNGEYRKASHKRRHAPSGLNWNLQDNRHPAKTKLNKDGKYRPNQ